MIKCMNSYDNMQLLNYLKQQTIISEEEYQQVLDYLNSPITDGEYIQTQFILNVPGANLNREHEIFKIKNMYIIFKELNCDLFEFEKEVHPGPDKTYDVNKMLPFTGWAHYHGIVSCREMEDLWKHNIEAVNYVLNCTKPSKSTIGTFLLVYKDLVSSFDEFIKKFAINLGLIEGKNIYWDGTFIKAYCNNHKKMYPAQILYLESFIKKNYDDYLNGNGNIWEMIRNYYYGDHTCPEKLSEIFDQLESVLNPHAMEFLKYAVLTDKKTKKALKRLKKMKKNIDGENSVSIVDPESRHMEDKKGKMGLNYNFQVGMDSKYGFIIDNYVTQNPNDQNELLTIVERLNNLLETDDYVLVADHGFWKIKHIEEIYGTNVMIIIPDRGAASRQKTINRLKNKISVEPEEINENTFKKCNFIYLPEEDAYLCPFGMLLTRHDKYNKPNRKTKLYACDHCDECPYKKLCAKNKDRREFRESINEAEEEAKFFFYSDEGQEAYSHRGHFGEVSFAIIFESRNFRGVKNRGIIRVNDEMIRVSLTHNLKKIDKHMSNYVLKKMVKEIRRLKETQDLTMDILKEWKDKLVYCGDKIVDIVF